MNTLMVIARPTPQRTPTLDELASRGVPFCACYLSKGDGGRGWGHSSLSHRTIFPASSFRAAAHCFWVVFSGEYSSVVSFGYRTPAHLAAILAARLRRSPIAIRSDSNIDSALEEGVLQRTLRKAVFRLLLPRRTSVWSIGTKNTQYWETLAGLKSQIRIPYEVPRLPGGYSPRDRTRERTSPLRVLFVGRLDPVKRVEDAILGVERARSLCDVEMELTIVGSGPSEPAIQRAAASRASVSVVGAVPYERLAEYYLEADVLVLPSSYEPWGLVVNEALGFGLFVVASEAVGAAHDLLSVDRGEIVPVGSPEAIAAGLLRAANICFQSGQGPVTNTADLMQTALAGMA